MEPKNYSKKIVPYIFKINDTQTLEAYLRKEGLPMKFTKKKEK